MSKHKEIFFTAICLITSTLLISGCSGGNRGGWQNNGGAQAQEETVFAVNTTKAVKGQINNYLELNGDVETESSVDVYADTMGKLTKLKITIGSRVKKDQVIAEVDPSRPGSTFVASPVKSPIDGTVTAIPVQVGSTIMQGISIARITSTDQVQIRTFVAERFVSRMKVGLDAILHFEAVPGTRFLGRITELSPVLDPASRTMEVKLKLNEPDARIKPGMFAKIKIITEKKDSIVKVPAECLVYRYGEYMVFVVKPEEEEDKATVQQRIVVPGIQIDNKLEIMDGLKTGEEVVVQGQTLLEDKTPVKIINRVEPLSIRDVVQ
ncbi:MAG: efflux RND transporter periplasmic adaptor subunit [Spirochaetales bacterium]|nr:efflux RND transporter periplasmic adaptor subunit [Spirochaetales bacterium]